VDEVSVTGDRATAQVTETTMLTYKKIRGDEPPTPLSFRERRSGYCTSTKSPVALTAGVVEVPAKFQRQ
jgi:hypothetical protein